MNGANSHRKPTNTARTYQDTRRRLLVDMHIPDFDDAFLSEFDPEAAAEDAIASGAEGVMIYFQSHTGLCNWPTKSGEQHKAFAGRDPMRPLISALRARGAGICAYYSTIFNNWAYNSHPDWRIKPAARGAMGPLPMARYGLCCPNNPDYRAFVRAQAEEIAGGYDIDTFFFDMMWWPAVCLCEHCEARAQKELGAPIPEKIDWRDAGWCAFQDTRERWITEFASELRALVKSFRENACVYHNFALAMSNWSRGVSFSSACAHDFLGGDFYGGRDEQLVISKLMLNLSERRPTEFMTTVARHLVDHEQLQTETHLKTQVCAALCCDAAFLMIAAVDPKGRTNPALTNRIRNVFEASAPYESIPGGEPIEDVAVYFSDASKMNFADDGTPLVGHSCGAATDYPHFNAVKGACRKLAEAHIPFGVITARQLSDLARYKVVVLPNVLRMRKEEIDAFRDYVRAGGRLYASRLTSLTLANGDRGDDFALADVFGCSFSREDDGRIIYLNPVGERLGKAIDPERFLGHRAVQRGMAGAVRLEAECAGDALATLTLPYGHPHDGSASDRNWASIHSDPPWTHTDEPAVVSHAFGDGRTVYVAADIETGEGETHARAFVALVRDLLGAAPRFSANAHPAIWMSAFNQPEHNRVIASFLNYQLDEPPLPVAGVDFEISPPPGRRFTQLVSLPDGADISFKTDPTTGRLSAVAKEIQSVAMYAAEYA